MVAPILIEGGIEIGGSITIGSEEIIVGPLWTFDPSYVGTDLALGNINDWNTGSTNTPYLEAYATNPESGIAIGLLNSGQSLYSYNPKVMFTTYVNTEAAPDVPLALAAVGIAYHSVDLNNPLGNDANSWGYRQNGDIWQNNTQLATGLPTWGPSDYIDVALNLTTAKAWVRVNGGSWNGDPATGSGGVALNMVVNGAAGSGTDVYPAVNPGAQNFVDAIDIVLTTYTIPAGFVAI